MQQLLLAVVAVHNLHSHLVIYVNTRCCLVLAWVQATMAPITDIWHTTLGDDSDMSDFFCPQLVSGSCRCDRRPCWLVAWQLAAAAAGAAGSQVHVMAALPASRYQGSSGM